MKTESEVLFERFCRHNNIRFESIKTRSDEGIRTPDYDLFVEETQIVVEVKQLDSNDEEKKIQRQLEERGWTDDYGGEPGSRLRSKISDAARQLKRRAQGQHPTLLVLYDNRLGIRGPFIDPYEIKTAMYGVEMLEIAVPHDSNPIPLVVDRRFDPKKRKIAPNLNTSISAITTLYEWGHGDNEIGMHLYHNTYARVPLDSMLLNLPTIQQFALADKANKSFQTWKRI